MAFARLHPGLLIPLVLLVAVVATNAAWRPSPETRDVGCLTWGSVKDEEQCMNLVETLRERGVSSMLLRSAELYETDSYFRTGDCHVYMHSVGQELFRLYGDKPLPSVEFSDVPTKVALCGVKLFHGYFQAYFGALGHGDGVAVEAAQRCKDGMRMVPKTLEAEYATECMLGIGYGYELAREDAVRDVPASVRDSIFLCERISEGFEKTSCSSGVYEAVMMLYLGRVSDTDIPPPLPQDPYSICREQEKMLKENCYIVLRSLVWTKTVDLQTAVSYAVLEPDIEVRLSAVKELARGAVNYYVRNGETNEYAFGECKRLADYLHEFCVRGEIRGMVFATHTPEEAAAYCRLSGLNSQERSACWSELAVGLGEYYYQDALSAACNELPEPYHWTCLRNPLRAIPPESQTLD